MQNDIRLARYIRWSYELSISLYCSFLFVLTNPSTNIWVVQRLPAPLSRLTRGIFSPDYSFNLQYTAMFLVAAIIFVILRFLGQIRPLNTFLCALAGGVVFLAPIFSRAWPSRPGWWLWLCIECIVSAAAVLLYANRKWPVNVAFMTAVVLFHCALWGYVALSGFDQWWEYHTLIEGLLLLPLCTSLAWVFYVWLLARPDPTR